MRSYSRARSIADQLAAGRRSEPTWTGDAQNPRDATENSVTDGLEELRQHLGQLPDHERFERGYADRQTNAFEPNGDDTAADDERDVPRFVAQHGDSQDDDGGNDDYDQDRSAASGSYAAAMGELQRRRRAAMWMPVWIIGGSIIPAVAGLAFLAHISTSQCRVAALDWMFQTKTSLTTLLAQADVAQTGMPDATANAPYTPPGVISAYGEPSEAALDMTSLIALSAPATESAAMTRLKSEPEVALDTTDTPDDSAATIMAAQAIASQSDAALLSAKRAEADDVLPAMQAALQTITVGSALIDVQIAWAGNKNDNPLVAVPLPTAQAALEPADAGRATTISRSATPIVAGLQVGPANAETIESRVVGSWRSTAARQATPRIRPRPAKGLQTGSAINKQMGLGLASTRAEAGRSQAQNSADQGAVVTLKRHKPRPVPQSSRAFLAKQQALKAAPSAPASVPTAIVRPPRPEKPGIKAWEVNQRGY
jgi:hypothetical protein